VAAGNGDSGSVELLLARGADVRAVDKQGHNALVAAFKCYGCLDKKLDMIEQLLAAGAPVNARNGGLSTTLIEAIIGARATIRASGGISTEALREQESKIMLRLIELGADLNTVDKDGNTALAMAREDKYITVVGEIERRMQASATDHPKSSQ
jgi:ankyrin repeat protein